MKAKFKIRFAGFEDILFWVGIGTIVNIEYLIIKDSNLIADEGFHLPQISRFLGGDWMISPDLTVLPGYHLIMAGLLKLAGANSIAEARVLTGVFSVLSIWWFYLIVNHLWPKERYIRTAQFALFPILFPLHFLFYTDAWGLMFVLVAIERAFARRAIQSAIAITLAALMRQPNIVWIGFTWIIFQEGSSIKETLSRLRSSWVRTTLPFIVVTVLFLFFVMLNHGVAVGDIRHQALALNLANVWFFGLCFFILFLPTCIGVVMKIWGGVSRCWAQCGIGACAAFFVYLKTYCIIHQYNQPSLWFYLRNRLLFCTSRLKSIKIVCFFPVIIGLLGFVNAPLKEERFRIVIPIALFSIVVMPLVEQRYYLVAFSIFMAVRRSEGRIAESLNLIAYTVCSFILLAGIASHKFFL